MSSKPLVLFVGNSIFKDDKIALVVGEQLREELRKQGFDVEITERSGLIFVDLLSGRENVVIVDSLKTGKFKVGDIVLLKDINYDAYTPFTPHYVGLPEALKLLKELDLDPPKKLCVIGIEVKDPYTISEKMSGELEKQFNRIVNEVKKIIKECLGKD